MSDERYEEVDEIYDINTTENSSSDQQPAEKERYEELAINSFTCAMVGLVIFGLILGIAAIVLAKKAKVKISENPSLKGKGLATAAIIIGILEIIVNVIGVLLMFAS